MLMIFSTLSVESPALCSKEKNQCTHPCLGSRFKSSNISRGVSFSHSGIGRLWLMYSSYTGRPGSSGFNVASR